jgi:tRNA nucleotidyltransferase (CCA-adding enzyme)
MTLFRHLDPFLPLAEAVRAAGGRLVFVGGCVRDAFLGVPTKDSDAEVFGLTEPMLLPILSQFDHVEMVGKAFSVYKLQGLHLDVSLPRRDIKQGPGHRGFLVEADPFISFEEAASRRDLTINSLGYDPLSGDVLDPFHGQLDIKDKILRPTNPARFGEDPLRALRAAVFAARFEMEPHKSLLPLMAQQNLGELPGERLRDEIEKLFAKSQAPSRCFKLLDRTGLLKFFPEIAALKGVPQHTYWHPEGDVWTHTMMVVDYAAKNPRRGGDHVMLMLAALCHDFGKPLTTTVEPDGAIRAKDHEEKGIIPTGVFLKRLTLSNRLQQQIKVLVRHHLKPVHYAKPETPRENFLLLARELHEHDLTMADLAWLARADGMGRTTKFALAGECPDVDAFWARTVALGADNPSVIADVLTGKDLLERGYKEGPSLGRLLEKARHLQYAKGLTTKDDVLKTLVATYPDVSL